MQINVDLYRFLKGISVDAVGNVIENELDKVPYIAKNFTPNLKASKIALSATDSLSANLSTAYATSAGSDTLIYMLQHTTIAVEHPEVYRLCQAVLLDVYSYAYAYQDNATLFSNLTAGDIDNTISNCLYLQDYFSQDDQYAQISRKFNDLTIMLGVLKNNLVLAKQLSQEKQV